MITLQMLYDTEHRAAVAREDAAKLQTRVAALRKALEEIRGLRGGIRDGGLCETGGPYLEGRYRAFEEAGKIATKALEADK